MAPTSRDTERAFAAAMSQFLGEAGFRKRTGLIFTWERPKEFLGWIGLNKASKHYEAGSFEVLPIVGVRDQELERLLAKVQGSKFHQYIPPTISSPLGPLRPEGGTARWVVVPDREMDAARAVHDAISRWGIPFIEKHADRERLEGAMENGIGFLHQLAYRRPLVRFLRGDAQGAALLLETLVSELGSRTDSAADEFRAFGKAFEAHLSSA